ncbi:MAG: hypothetical protein AAFQ68_20275, partial [Bacteroidota bacterium]
MIRFISTIILLGLYLSPAAQQLSTIYGGGVRTEIDPISCALLPSCNDQNSASEDFCLDGFCAHNFVAGIPNAPIGHMDRYDNGEIVMTTDYRHSVIRHSVNQTSILKVTDPRIPKYWFFSYHIPARMDANGAIWIPSWIYNGSILDYGLVRWSGSQVDTFRMQSPPPNYPVDLEIGPNGSVYLLTNNENLVSFDGQNWQSTNLNSNPALANLQLKQLQFDTNGDLWLSGYNNQWDAALAHFDGTNWMTYQSSISLVGSNTSFLISANGDKWLGSGHQNASLARFNGSWTAYNGSTIGNLPPETRLNPKEGPNNTLWLASGTNGITRLDINTGTYTQFSSQNSGYPFSEGGLIAAHPNSNEIHFNNPVLGENEIGQYDGITWNVISPVAGPGEENNHAFLSLEADGRIWYRGQYSKI